LIDLLIKELPPSFITDLQHAVPNIYREAHQQAFVQPLWEDSEARYLIGHFRHALFAAHFRKAARNAGLKTGLQRVPTGSYQYTWVRAGRLLLTASAVQSEDDAELRYAEFREQHATVNHLLTNPVLPFMDQADLNALETVYGIVVHAPYEDDKSQCSYVGIGIPAHETMQWVERLSLAELSKAQAETNRAETEQLEDQAFPRKKDKRKEGTGDEQQ